MSQTYFIIMTYPRDVDMEHGATFRTEVQADSLLEAIATARAEAWVEEYSRDMYDDEEIADMDGEPCWADNMQVVYVHEGPSRALSVYRECEVAGETMVQRCERHDAIDFRIAEATRTAIRRLRESEVQA